MAQPWEICWGGSLGFLRAESWHSSLGPEELTLSHPACSLVCPPSCAKRGCAGLVRGGCGVEPCRHPNAEPGAGQEPAETPSQGLSPGQGTWGAAGAGNQWAAQGYRQSKLCHCIPHGLEGVLLGTIYDSNKILNFPFLPEILPFLVPGRILFWRGERMGGWTYLGDLTPVKHVPGTTVFTKESRGVRQSVPSRFPSCFTRVCDGKGESRACRGWRRGAPRPGSLSRFLRTQEEQPGP